VPVEEGGKNLGSVAAEPKGVVWRRRLRLAVARADRRKTGRPRLLVAVGVVVWEWLVLVQEWVVKREPAKTVRQIEAWRLPQEEALVAAAVAAPKA